MFPRMLARGIPVPLGTDGAVVNGTAGAVANQDNIPFAILAFTVASNHIVSIDVFNDPELVPRLVRPRPDGARHGDAPTEG